MPTLHINGWTPPARAIAIALAEKGIAFDIVECDWRDTPAVFTSFANSREIANSLEGEFPILVDNGLALSDSYFVLEYIEDRYPQNALLLQDAYSKWRWQAFARFLGERALPAISSLGVARDFGSLDEAFDFDSAALPTSERTLAWLNALTDPCNEAILGESRRKLDLLLGRLDKMLGEGGGPWLIGSSYGLADIAAYALADPLLNDSLAAEGASPTQAVREWHSRVSGRPAVQAATQGRETVFLPGPEHARWG